MSVCTNLFCEYDFGCAFHGSVIVNGKATYNIFTKKQKINGNKFDMEITEFFWRIILDKFRLNFSKLNHTKFHTMS